MNPRDDNIVVNFTIGQPSSQFPSGLGTDIGQQRSTIDIHFSGSLTASKTLIIRWTPGGSTAVDQFSITLDGTFVGSSKALSGLPNPYTYVTEGFRLPSATGKNHVLRLNHLKGDGLAWDALQLGGCVTGRFPMSLKKGTGGSGWIYQAEVETFASQGYYAFSGNDSVHPVFQVVGQPTVKKPIK